MPPVTGDATRERIIDAAEECFGRFGVAKTTVEDIAAAAKLSRATVYRSVTGGRDELILAVVVRDLHRFLDRLAERLRRERSVSEAIVEGTLDAVEYVRDEPPSRISSSRRRRGTCRRPWPGPPSTCSRCAATTSGPISSRRSGSAGSGPTSRWRGPWSSSSASSPR
ncbi:TetR/AcrR family transcriptional regulator [Actinomadura madurae]|uniref:TetR/AcrR family transcriptional regulator n=1 Tax=Actinomadura madurae TaxID=1993 RepID=UPI0020D21F29|nr:TetR/AcrR family transcriptional regulator [Actinomadura madurae]MCP9970386.1 TetR/AcrR family transcriptional regulator [Actinomadura madurae]MCP9982868.1 TetR/AcrR family transcriptional regulator [Actinomadura madurae]MCQ0005581.1 TetR/AcrR family transcriptional regulator [Actinomadura madurae]